LRCRIGYAGDSNAYGDGHEPRAQEVLLDLLRAAPPFCKLQMADDLNRSLRQLVSSELDRTHADCSDEELRILVGERLYRASVAEMLSKALSG
jgi:hypothetical protein